MLFPGEVFSDRGVGEGGIDVVALGFHEHSGGPAGVFFGEGVLGEEGLDEGFGFLGGGFFGEVFLDDGDLGFELGDFRRFAQFFVFFDAFSQFLA
jgi:hypothetical protein